MPRGIQPMLATALLAFLAPLGWPASSKRGLVSPKISAPAAIISPVPALPASVIINPALTSAADSPAALRLAVIEEHLAVKAIDQLSQASSIKEEPSNVAAVMDGSQERVSQDRLQFARAIAPYVGSQFETKSHLDAAAAQRGVSYEDISRLAFTELHALQKSPHYASLPAAMRGQFEETLAVLAMFNDLPAAPTLPKRAPLKAGEKPRGKVHVGGGKMTEVLFDRPAQNSNATFMVTETSSKRRLALKTARYVSIEPGSTQQMVSSIKREVAMLDMAETISQRRDFPRNVWVPKVIGPAVLSDELAHDVYGDSRMTPAFIMEASEGVTLTQYLNSGGLLRVEDLRALFQAYRRMHLDGLAHGDVTAENILVFTINGKRQFRILDFQAGQLRSEHDAENWKALAEADLRALAAIQVQFQDAGQLSSF